MATTTSTSASSTSTTADAATAATATAPEGFDTILRDFTRDIVTTFPEYSSLVNKWWNESEPIETRVSALFAFSLKKYPPRFFDILYQNESLFAEDTVLDTEFLPQIHFKNLWHLGISDTTKQTIWKYLQLVLFSVVTRIDNRDSFGDTLKQFEEMPSELFRDKLEEVLGSLPSLMTPSEEDAGAGAGTGTGTGTGAVPPNASELHSHLTGLLDGKLGKLAKEIAEEAASDWNMDLENMGDSMEAIQKLMKNPAKLMGLVKNVGEKLDTKMKSGEIKENELLEEAGQLLQKMKNVPGMPGMGNLQELFSKMGMPGAGAGAGGAGSPMDQLSRQLVKSGGGRPPRHNGPRATPPAAPPLFTDEQLISMFSGAGAGPAGPGAGPGAGAPRKGKKSKK